MQQFPLFPCFFVLLAFRQWGHLATHVLLGLLGAKETRHHHGEVWVDGNFSQWEVCRSLWAKLFLGFNFVFSFKASSKLIFRCSDCAQIIFFLFFVFCLYWGLTLNNKTKNSTLFGLKTHYISISKEFLALHTFLVSTFSIPISGILTYSYEQVTWKSQFSVKMTLHVCNTKVPFRMSKLQSSLP